MQQRQQQQGTPPLKNVALAGGGMILVVVLVGEVAPQLSLLLALLLGALAFAAITRVQRGRALPGQQ